MAGVNRNPNSNTTTAMKFTFKRHRREVPVGHTERMVQLRAIIQIWSHYSRRVKLLSPQPQH